MVSTYLAYNSIVRNFRQSMTRVEQQADVTRNAAYYRENIGKVKSVDDLLKNDRLYQYAMKAYGLEDMTYAKAFMKKVLESDLSDANSYANKLVDKRYREFAAAFTFGGSDTAIAQSESQTDEMIGLYKATVTRQVDAIDEDTRYYNLMIGSVTNVDQLLNDDRLRTYVFAAFGIDDSQWSRETIRGVLCSDPTDPNSYVNTVWVSRLDEFASRLDQAKADLVDANTKISDYMAQLSQPGADMNDLRARITMERARLSKSNADIASYNDAISMISRYVDLAAGFEFSPDGTLPSGMPAQIEANREVTNEGFVLSKGAVYLAAEEENETLAINQFRSLIYKMQSVEQFVSTPNVYNFALKAVGLDPQKVSAATIKAVLRSDPTDPKSYVYTLKDDRYVQLARALNFDGKGSVTTPLVAQDAAEVVQIARDYIVAKTKFASSTEQAALRAKAEKDAVYYRNAIADVGSVTELLKDRRMVDILLVSKGLDPAKVTTDYLRKISVRTSPTPKALPTPRAIPALPRSRRRSISTKRATSPVWRKSGRRSAISFWKRRTTTFSRIWKRSRAMPIRVCGWRCISSARPATSPPPTTFSPTRRSPRCFAPPTACPTRSAAWRSTSRPRWWENIST
jgi:hypothetical protein